MIINVNFGRHCKYVYYSHLFSSRKSHRSLKSILLGQLFASMHTDRFAEKAFSRQELRKFRPEDFLGASVCRRILHQHKIDHAEKLLLNYATLGKDFCRHCFGEMLQYKFIGTLPGECVRVCVCARERVCLCVCVDTDNTRDSISRQVFIQQIIFASD